MKYYAIEEVVVYGSQVSRPLFVVEKEETTKDIHEETPLFSILTKYGECEVIRAYAELETSPKSRIDGSMNVKPIMSVVVLIKE